MARRADDRWRRDLHEAFQRIVEPPRRFFELVAAATEPSIDEIVDSELTSRKSRDSTNIRS